MVTIVNRIVNKQEVGTLANGMQLERSEASAPQGNEPRYGKHSMGI